MKKQKQTLLNVSALELNGGTILDLASNTASLTLDYVTSNSTNLSDSKSIELLMQKILQFQIIPFQTIII
jgi:hypothetical protein